MKPKKNLLFGRALIIHKDLEELTREIMEMILTRCKSRVKKEAVCLENRMRYIYGHQAGTYIRPVNVAVKQKQESAVDRELLGDYGEQSHDAYMRLCEVRIRKLKEMATVVTSSNATSEIATFVELCKLAYDVRRSGAFEHFIDANLQRDSQPGVSIPEASKIHNRLGQISKFYRAALNIIALVIQVKSIGGELDIQALPATRVEIPELAGRQVAHLRQRADREFKLAEQRKFSHTLGLWRRYRQHAELQLLIFYEENPHIKLASSYIGCNKLSCYLCHSFIQHHGRFRVNGGHQSLYSLWTVKNTVNFENLERATFFHCALEQLCLDLTEKVKTLKAVRWRRLGFETGNESIPNLSRISLPPPAMQGSLPEVAAAHGLKSHLHLKTIVEVPVESSGALTNPSASKATDSSSCLTVYPTPGSHSVVLDTQCPPCIPPVPISIPQSSRPIIDTSPTRSRIHTRISFQTRQPISSQAQADYYNGRKKRRSRQARSTNVIFQSPKLPHVKNKRNDSIELNVRGHKRRRKRKNHSKKSKLGSDRNKKPSSLIGFLGSWYGQL